MHCLLSENGGVRSIPILVVVMTQNYIEKVWDDSVEVKDHSELQRKKATGMTQIARESSE
jgi:hypothetical protein